jgi:hypothetical protein
MLLNDYLSAYLSVTVVCIAAFAVMIFVVGACCRVRMLAACLHTHTHTHTHAHTHTHYTHAHT